MGDSDKPEARLATELVLEEETVYTGVGKLEDGTRVVRDSNGLLHALVPVKRACDAS
jgi:hypothetical protein